MKNNIEQLQGIVRVIDADMRTIGRKLSEEMFFTKNGLTDAWKQIHEIRGLLLSIVKDDIKETEEFEKVKSAHEHVEGMMNKAKEKTEEAFGKNSEEIR